MKIKKYICLLVTFLFISGTASATYIQELASEIPSTHYDNSGWCFMKRSAGLLLSVEDAVMTGTGSVVVNVFKFTGTILVLNQWAQITEITTLTNLTNMYSTIYDGTNTVSLTADGAVLSGAPVGTFFTKNLIATGAYNVSFADECRVVEVLLDKKAGRPFTVTAKTGVDNFIQFRYTTTDNPVSFKMDVWFEYIPINGGTLEVVE